MRLVHLEDEARVQSIVPAMDGANNLEDYVRGPAHVVQPLDAAHVRVDHRATDRERVCRGWENNTADANEGSDWMQNGVGVEVLVGQKRKGVVAVARPNQQLVLRDFDAVERSDNSVHDRGNVVDDHGHSCDEGERGRLGG